FERSRRMRASIATICLAALFFSPNNAEAKRKRIAYVGEIRIVGNSVTQDRVIRQALVGIEPGQILRPRRLKVAEKKLAAMGLFMIDPVRGIRPRVWILDVPGQFKDIL